MSELSTHELSNADLRLQTAMDRLSETTSTRFDDVMDNVGHSLSESVESVSDAVVRSIRDIKSELNVASIAKDQPWTLVAGAFVGGALFEYVTVRLRSASRLPMLTPNVTSMPNSAAAATMGLSTPILLAVTRWGLRRILS